MRKEAGGAGGRVIVRKRQFMGLQSLVHIYVFLRVALCSPVQVQLACCLCYDSK